MELKTSCQTNSLTRLTRVIVISFFLTPMVAPATVLFSDNFNTDTSANWTVNVAPAANAAQQDAVFAFDYSPYGIPAAPGTADTLGLRLRSNIPGSAAAPVTTRPGGTISGLSVSPTGMNFGSNYQLTFYAWVNFNGAANASGLADNANSEGGTHNVLFAVGTSGTVPLVVGNTSLASGASMDGVAFATTGDGGIGSDYRIYPKSGTVMPTNTGYYAANSTSNVATYYINIPSLAPHTAPAIQQTLSTAEYGGDAANTQAGSTQIGAFGFTWHKVDVIKYGNYIRWSIDDTVIAAGDFSSLAPLGGGNIALGDSDVNTSTTRHPSLLFTLIDNLVVTDLKPVIQTTNSGGNLNLSWPAAESSGFVLQSNSSLAMPAGWANVVGTFTTNSGTISVSLPATGDPIYFRLKL